MLSNKKKSGKAVNIILKLMRVKKKIKALAPIKMMTSTINLFLMIRSLKLHP